MALSSASFPGLITSFQCCTLFSHAYTFNRSIREPGVHEPANHHRFCNIRTHMYSDRAGNTDRTEPAEGFPLEGGCHHHWTVHLLSVWDGPSLLKCMYISRIIIIVHIRLWIIDNMIVHAYFLHNCIYFEAAEKWDLRSMYHSKELRRDTTIKFLFNL